MVKKQAPDIRIPVALGSGLATTLLFVSLRQGTFPAWLVGAFSPLPLMIATLGFGHATGLGAVAVSVLTFATLMIAAAAPQNGWLDAALTVGLAGLIFAVCQALPSWWLAYLATLSRADAALPWTVRRNDKGRERDYYPLGLIALNAALIGFAIVALPTFAASLAQTNFQAGVDKAAAEIAPFIVQALGSYELPHGIDLIQLARLVVRAMPPVAASIIFAGLLINLWLAGRVVQVSNRLTRPWPDIAHEFKVPRMLGIAFAASAALCLLNGVAGMIASIAAAVLALLFALQGICVIHDLSRGNKFRGPLLCGLYLALAFLMPWPLVVFTLLGLIEAGFCLRDRKATAAAPH
jgi:uncharacterized membrane protein